MLNIFRFLFNLFITITITLTSITSPAVIVPNSENLDYVYPAFVFEVLHANGTSQSWPRQWGWCHFDDVDVKLLGE